MTPFDMNLILLQTPHMIRGNKTVASDLFVIMIQRFLSVIRYDTFTFQDVYWEEGRRLLNNFLWGQIAEFLGPTLISPSFATVYMWAKIFFYFFHSWYTQVITDSTFNRDSTFNFKKAHLIDRTVRLIKSRRKILKQYI